MHKPTLLFAAALSAVTLAACGPVEDTRPGQPVKTRQNAFKDMLRTTEPMGAMFRQETYDAAQFEKLAEKLHSLRDAPWTHFGPDTQYPPSRSLDKVWSDQAGFQQLAETFKTRTDTLLQAARSHDAEQAKHAFDAVQDSCRECHQSYRKK